jgi:hypothetical protein
MTYSDLTREATTTRHTDKVTGRDVRRVRLETTAGYKTQLTPLQEYSCVVR